MERTLFLEEVVALKTGTETINGLTSFADPESDGVESSAQCSHFNNSVCQVTGGGSGNLTSGAYTDLYSFFLNIPSIIMTPRTILQHLQV
jgi:hypothetical protein